jgi:ribosomal protein S18 acetylase RimI-like enzyme
MNVPCRHLEWDSAFFGKRIGRVQSTLRDAEAAREVETWAHSQAIDCLYHLVDAADVAAIRRAEESGFLLADVRVSLEHRASAGGTPAPEGVRICAPGDLPGLLEQARAHHEQTRFFRDARFSPERARDLYALWLEKTYSDPGGRIFLAEREGRSAGYIACEIGPGKTGRIALAGVDPAHRGKGVGTQLVRAALDWFEANGTTSRNVVTQGANIPALRLYASNGFYPVRTELWYHKWYTNPESS